MYKRTDDRIYDKEGHRTYARIGGKRNYMGVKSNDKLG